MRHVILMSVREAGECRRRVLRLLAVFSVLAFRLGRLLSGSPSHILLLCFGTPLQQADHHFGAMTRLSTHTKSESQMLVAARSIDCGVAKINKIQNKKKIKKTEITCYASFPTRWKIFILAAYGVLLLSSGN